MNQYGSLLMVPEWELVPGTDKVKAGIHVNQQDFYQRNSQAHSTTTVCMNTVRGRPVFHSKSISEFFQLWPWTPSAFFRLRLPPSSRDTSEYFLFQAPSSSPQHYRMLLLSGDDLFSAPKLSWSFSNSDLRHLWHPLDSDHLWVPETLRSTSYSDPLPTVPNATTCSFHSDPSPNTPSEGCSETSASSEGNSETSLDSTPSDPDFALTFFRDSLSRSGDRVIPMASDIKGCVIKLIHDIKGQWWSGLVGNARRWPWS